MPIKTTSIYSDYDAFSKLIDRISLDDIDAYRQFCGPNNREFEKLECEPKTLGSKDWNISDLCVTKKKQAINKWLRDRTSSLDFGKEIIDKERSKMKNRFAIRPSLPSMTFSVCQLSKRKSSRHRDLASLREHDQFLNRSRASTSAMRSFRKLTGIIGWLPSH